jgi:hypothetical protein
MEIAKELNQIAKIFYDVDASPSENEIIRNY